MVEVILLQIPPLIREVLWVCAVYHHDCIMYAEHVLLNSLILLLLDIMQGSYHGIIVALVTECLLHVHQQVLHGDILAFIQHASPFTEVSMETGKNVRVHTCLITLPEEGIHIKPPECVCHLHPWIKRLKDRHIQSHRCQLLLLPTPSVAPASMPAARGLTHSGVPIRVQCPLSEEERSKPPPPTTAWSHSPCMGGEPSISCPFHCIGSPSLLGCASHQLTQGIRLPCIHDWNIMDWVLSLAPQLLAIRGSNCLPPHLHQRKEANGKVGRA